MDFNYLDKESEALLKELKQTDDFSEITKSGPSIQHLLENGFIKGFDITTDDSKVIPEIIIEMVTQKGLTYFEMKKKYEKEKKRITRREVISAIIGACIGLIPWLISII
ncbi:MAG: hypothetical protein ACPKMZ_12405 [Pleomorphochaeta sp.]